MMEHWNGKIVQMKKNNRKKFYIVTTVPASLNFFKGQLAYLSNDFEVVAISSDKKILSTLVREKELILTISQWRGRFHF